MSFDTFLVNFNTSYNSSKFGVTTVYINYRDVNYSFENLADTNNDYFYESIIDENISKITVSDNGIGMPEGMIDRLTEPYVTTRSKGTGLGLAIVKKIMKV